MSRAAPGRRAHGREFPEAEFLDIAEDIRLWRPPVQRCCTAQLAGCRRSAMRHRMGKHRCGLMVRRPLRARMDPSPRWCW